MARTLCVARRRIPPRMRWRRILVASLLIQNPTTADHGGAAADSFAVEPEATAGLRRSRRTRSRRVAAAALDLPEDIMVWEIFVRLPAKDVLCCRAVCRSWRGLTSANDFLRAHHRRQPSLPLVTLYGASSTERGLPFLERDRPVLGFDDYGGFKLLASCDGPLLHSLSDGRYSMCNPATGQCAPLPCLTAARCINVVSLYLHGPSGEYLVLYWKGKNQDHLEVAYYILMVRRGRSPRCIQVPSDTPAIEKLMRDSDGMAPSNCSPPILSRNRLHWIPRFPSFLASGARIVVLDTVVESFRLMCSPVGATKSCPCLCDMKGSVGFSCFDDRTTAAKIWLLEDYERQVWSFKYHVKFPVESLCTVEDTRHLVLSHKGDVLVYSCSKGYMFHCDNTGKLLEEFRCDPWSLSMTVHWFKESLIKQDISLRRGCGCVRQLRFFERV